jgi:hypothetical protein
MSDVNYSDALLVACVKGDMGHVSFLREKITEARLLEIIFRSEFVSNLSERVSIGLSQYTSSDGAECFSYELTVDRRKVFGVLATVLYEASVLCKNTAIGILAIDFFVWLKSYLASLVIGGFVAPPATLLLIGMSVGILLLLSGILCEKIYRHRYATPVEKIEYIPMEKSAID